MAAEGSEDGADRSGPLGEPASRPPDSARQGRIALRELRERKVVQWTAAYMAGAWLLSQVLGFAVTTFGWPMPILRVAVVFLAFGVPAVLVLSWCHGDKGHQRVGRGETALLGLILAAALGVGLHVSRGGGELARDQAPAASASPAAFAAKTANSVAVLPFVNMSAEPETEYFSDGMTEELTNALGRVEGLKVAARSSAFSFKGKDIGAREVGRSLGVAAVIEGSVRKSRDRLRISVQLVDAAGGHQIWAESYERELTDVFAVQEEIAQAVVAALRVRLTRSSRLVAEPTQNLDAYQAYLRGRFFWNRRDGGGLQKALTYFQQAVEHDPAYARAWAGLADTYLLLPLHTPISTKEAFPRAKAAAERAVAIDESLAEGHTSLAYVLFWNDWNYPAAERAFRRAIELNPNYATAHHWFSEYLVTSGRLEEAIAEAARAEALDPLSPIISTDAAANFYFARRYDEAERRLRRVLELDPDFLVARWYLGKTHVQQGKHAAAVAELERAVAASERSDWSRAYLGYAYGAAGRRDEARRVLEAMTRQAKARYVRPDILALLHMAVGERSQALDEFDRAVDERAVYPFLMARDPMLDPLRGEARFAALLRRMSIPQ